MAKIVAKCTGCGEQWEGDDLLNGPTFSFTKYQQHVREKHSIRYHLKMGWPRILTIKVDDDPDRTPD